MSVENLKLFLVINCMINMCPHFQFGDLLDENSDIKFDNMGMNAMANKDKASEY